MALMKRNLQLSKSCAEKAEAATGEWPHQGAAPTPHSCFTPARRQASASSLLDCPRHRAHRWPAGCSRMACSVSVTPRAGGTALSGHASSVLEGLQPARRTSMLPGRVRAQGPWLTQAPARSWRGAPLGEGNTRASREGGPGWCIGGKRAKLSASSGRALWRGTARFMHRLHWLCPLSGQPGGGSVSRAILGGVGAGCCAGTGGRLA